MTKIHPTADVSKSVKIGKGTLIWHQAQIREGAKIGKNCIIGKGVYIDKGVEIGNNVKIQNYASIYHKAKLEDGVFIGPYVCLTNDKLPRAITTKGKLKSEDSWNAGKTIIKRGASIGAGSVLLSNLTIGEFVLVGASSLITKDIPKHTLVYGVPATTKGYVCACANIISRTRKPKIYKCKVCREKK